MKKLLLVFTVAAFLTACNGSSTSSEATTDSATVVATPAPAPVDTAAAAAPAVKDSAAATAPAATDSSKK